MKCSLLTLSTFIDDELPSGRRAEVDAHLVGCPRCSAGAATLREEKVRVGRLARVHIDEGSAQVMLEQVGIAVEPVGAGPPSIPPPPRPTSTPAAIEEVTVPDVSPDTQPDLPFAGAETAHGRHDAVPATVAEASPEVEADSADPSHGGLEAGQAWAAADEDWIGSAAYDSWEADLPPPVEPHGGGGDPWAASPGWVEAPPPPPLPPPVGLPSMPAPAPTRVPAAGGPAALFSRARDAVAVYLALARGRGDPDDSVELVGGAHPRRRAAVPPPVSAPPGEATAATAVAAAGSDAPSAIELNGKRGVTLTPHSDQDVGAAAAGVEERVAEGNPAGGSATSGLTADGHEGAGAAATEGWHAFAASSYPPDSGVSAAPPSAAPRPLGRHGRAVARKNDGLLSRASAALGAATSGLRGGLATAAGSVRTWVRSESRGGPDSRLLAGIAGIGLIFVVALLIGHASTSSRATTAARPASSSSGAVNHAQPSSVAQSSAASSAPSPAPSSAPLPPTVATPAAQSFGSGAIGFQAVRLRFGEQPTYMRIVFDLGMVSGPVSGTPRVTVAFSDPRTVLLTLNGTAPAASIATPSGTIISSITLVSGNAERTEYRIALDRPATAKAFFLSSPTRFVLDLH